MEMIPKWFSKILRGDSEHWKHVVDKLAPSLDAGVSLEGWKHRRICLQALETLVSPTVGNKFVSKTFGKFLSWSCLQGLETEFVFKDLWKNFQYT